MSDVFLGLGLSELAVILIAIVVLLGPKSLVSLKPLFKAIYKGWLLYQKESMSAQHELDEVRETVMEPIKEAEHEAENELNAMKKDFALEERMKALPKAAQRGFAQQAALKAPMKGQLAAGAAKPSGYAAPLQQRPGGPAQVDERKVEADIENIGSAQAKAGAEQGARETGRAKTGTAQSASAGAKAEAAAAPKADAPAGEKTGLKAEPPSGRTIAQKPKAAADDKPAQKVKAGKAGKRKGDDG